jgi:hypothetical protein
MMTSCKSHTDLKKLCLLSHRTTTTMMCLKMKKRARLQNFNHR